MSSSLQSLVYSRGSLTVIDQLKLPHELVYVEIANSEDAWSAIRTMQVRGAPLIAIVAALSLAVDVCKVSHTFKSSSDAADFLKERMTYLRTSRPTAVNLFVATDELLATVLELESAVGSTAESVVEGFLSEAEVLYSTSFSFSLDCTLTSLRAITSSYINVKSFLQVTAVLIMLLCLSEIQCILLSY